MSIPSNNPSYRSISGGKVASSNQIDDNVVADYDAGGNVVGLEFLDTDVAKEWEKFLAIANQKRPTSGKVPKPPASSAAA
jgi:uncharacterized protein YuzE